uniref:Uncharacterized protein n=1 Tax=Amphimedon queenslandica TaxID=400682 RepID=A0A1X7SEQ4_AMPQE
TSSSISLNPIQVSSYEVSRAKDYYMHDQTLLYCCVLFISLNCQKIF